MIKYRAIEITIRSFKSINPIETNEVLIVKYNNQDKRVWVPSCLTNFIYHRYNRCAINTKMKVARIVCAFINYLNYQVELCEDNLFNDLKYKGLYGLNHYHLAKYINYISNRSGANNSYDTVKDKEWHLVKFYSFLYSRGIISEESKIQKKLITNGYGNKKGYYVEISPFVNNNEITVEYPSKRKIPSRILKDMEVDVWNRFLEYAEEYYPNIVLGVSFQFMGGLRLGEIVNLQMDSITLCGDKQYIKVDIVDNQESLFRKRGIKLLKSQNKKLRFNQPIFNFNGELFEIYDRHLKRLANNPKITNRNALFVNSFGDPMSGESYSRYFTNLKNDFIKYLADEGYVTLANKLLMHKWNTHIGRHIFTNYLIKIGAVSDAKGDPVGKYLMALRGDTCEKSSLTYIEVKSVVDVVIDKINLISKVASKY